MRACFCVWCVKCAKYLAFGTFGTPDNNALTHGICDVILQIAMIYTSTGFGFGLQDGIKQIRNGLYDGDRAKIYYIDLLLF